MRRPFQHWTRFCEFKPRQVARYKCFAEGKTLAGLHITAIEAVICSGNRFSLTQQSAGLLLPASTPLRVCEVRSSFRFPPQALLQKIRDAIRRLLFFGAGYGNRTRLLGLGSRCTTDVLTLQSEAIIADFPAQCKAKFACRHSFPYMPPAGGIGWGKGHKKECIP